VSNEAIEAIQRDLRDNAAGFLRAVLALGMYRRLRPDTMEKVKDCLREVLAELGLELGDLAELQAPAARGITYAGLDAREAAILDLAVFGEGRTIEEVQSHVFSFGFEQARAGQIRSSINALANRNVLFNVGPKETITLTEEAQTIAQKLKRRFGLS
jgi:hypothetical protein